MINIKSLNIHAGHNPDGKTACGAVSIIKESTEARNVLKELIDILSNYNITIHNCTVDNGTSKSDVLNKIVAKCNSHKVDLDISIHFNSGAKDKNGNGKSCGTEVFVHNVNSDSYPYAKRIVENISALGFANRGVKVEPDYAVLRKTNAPALLIECCFVDDADDVKMYNPRTMAEAIAKGILGDKYNEKQNNEVKKNTMKINVDGKIYDMESILIEGSTYIKLREFAKAGYKIDYINNTPCIFKP